MSLSVFLLVASATHLRCTFFVRPSTYSAFFLLLCFVLLQAHTHTQDAHCSGLESFFCSVCWQLRVAAIVFFRCHEKGGEGVRSPRLFSCGCGAPRVTALSWAPCPIEGGMAGNFVPRHGWMRLCFPFCFVWWVLAPCTLRGGRGVLPFPWGSRNELGEMVVDAVSWCVSCAAGPAAFSSFCLLSLSLYPLCSVSLPPVALFSLCITDQLTGSSDSTTGDDDDGDGAAPCWSLRSRAAARPCV
ncbi:hypothetical protein TCDM_12729 [Trypanosoma cruzi Dm28c]|uniref:Uncharacterized protein n=1 Tax=Trypanosoma cruzi Dm28c TaxID=1416333 RepID=V5A4U1_TRYCR|nr:hypothetical protein TCDM_12729 [Trypanosoma cruzi Dm28c]